jgi:hypothetical protein
LLPKKKTSSGFEFVSGLATGASAMPAKWSRRVFSFRFYEGKISVPVTLTSSLPRSWHRTVIDCSAKLGRRRDVADGVDLFTVPPTNRSKPCQRRHDAANTQRAS